MNTNSKVVCVDDKNQRTDVNEGPDGLVEQGKVYAVAGVTKHGLVLVGLRSLSKRTGRETGFRASRFVTLEYHRAEFCDKTNREGPAELAECHRPPTR